ncbi:synaptojanin-2-binding protein isoform X2 [Dendropsophus ebraccatus]|uniref:synaptojanin-2-binding protein isoform X2 n=1 Tax=Dendropsophus ebraccatus TaxID=150705 RepID=UPI003831ABCA
MSAGAVEEIELIRGPSGLGFNIVGGTDQQYVSHDSGIYVSSIKENGAAAVDGRLQEGDRILEVNGIILENLLHKAAVDLFRSSGEHVVLKVQHQVSCPAVGGPLQGCCHGLMKTRLPNHLNGPLGGRSERDSEGTSLTMIVVPVLLAAAAIYAFVKFRQRSARF